MVYTLKRSVRLGTDIQKCWQFIRKPENLNVITPPDMHFQILSNVPEVMHNGLLIEYSIRIPGFGRRQWLTEIKHIEEGLSFVDEQRYGPFRFWYHHHLLVPLTDNEVESLDTVHYVVPYGYLGRVLHRFKIRKMLEQIFTYRQQKLQEIFPPF